MDQKWPYRSNTCDGYPILLVWKSGSPDLLLSDTECSYNQSSIKSWEQLRLFTSIGNIGDNPGTLPTAREDQLPYVCLQTDEAQFFPKSLKQLDLADICSCVENLNAFGNVMTLFWLRWTMHTIRTWCLRDQTRFSLIKANYSDHTDGLLPKKFIDKVTFYPIKKLTWRILFRKLHFAHVAVTYSKFNKLTPLKCIKLPIGNWVRAGELKQLDILNHVLIFSNNCSKVYSNFMSTNSTNYMKCA